MSRTIRVLFLSLILSNVSYGQQGTHSPYSLFGIGELQFNDFATFQSMGGVSMGSTDSAVVNSENPASYTYIGRLRPVFQIGLNGRFSRFETATTSTRQRHFGLNQFQMGIPIKKKWGAGIGIKPYSFTGYAISNYVVEDGDSTQLYTSEGDGGITNYYLGVAYRPLDLAKKSYKGTWMKDSTGARLRDTIDVTKTHRISIGGNLNYLAGSSNKVNTFQYASTAQGLNARVENALRISDITYEFGLNYEHKWKSTSRTSGLKKANALSVGLAYVPGRNMRAYRDVFSYSYINVGGFNGAAVISDTIDYIRNNKGSVHIPETIKGGLEFRFDPKSDMYSSLVRIATDFRYQKWSNYNESFGEVYTNQLTDRLQLGLGIEWTPATVIKTRTPFLSRGHYRLGFNYAMTELNVLNNLNQYTELSSYGMSFGVGFPIALTDYSNTNINFGANIGNLGTTDNGLIQERYIGFFVGFSLTPGRGDLWFLKRKYD